MDKIDELVGHYRGLWQYTPLMLEALVGGIIPLFADPARRGEGDPVPAGYGMPHLLMEPPLEAMWKFEEHMPRRLRRLYYRELFGPASRFEECHGVGLPDDAYEWTLVHPTAEDRMRAFVSTHLLALLAEIHDEGGDRAADHPALAALEEEFAIAAAESGADRELDYDSEAWVEGEYEELFKPLRT